jgi:predicted nucleic acid-binding protein
MSVFIDTNVIVRHLTGDPPDLAVRATRFLADAGPHELRLADLVLAEVVYVLESFYRVPRAQLAEYSRAIVAFPAIRVQDPAMLLRAIEVYEKDRLDFADAYLVALAERSPERAAVSFDKVDTIQRLVPPE